LYQGTASAGFSRACAPRRGAFSSLYIFVQPPAGADLQVCEGLWAAENAHLKGVRQPNDRKCRNSLRSPKGSVTPLRFIAIPTGGPVDHFRLIPLLPVAQSACNGVKPILSFS